MKVLNQFVLTILNLIVPDLIVNLAYLGLSSYSSIQLSLEALTVSQFNVPHNAVEKILKSSVRETQPCCHSFIGRRRGCSLSKVLYLLPQILWWKLSSSLLQSQA